MTDLEEFWMNIKIEGMFHDANSFLKLVSTEKDVRKGKKLQYPDSLYDSNTFGATNRNLKEFQDRFEETYLGLSDIERKELFTRIRQRKESCDMKLNREDAINPNGLKELYILCDFMQDIIKYIDNGHEMDIEDLEMADK